MLGLLFALAVLVVIICVLGFILAFVHNLFEQEELPVSRAIGIIFLSIVAGIIVGIGLQSTEMDEGTISLIGTLTNFLILSVLIKTLAYTTWGKAALIALVFSIVMYVASLTLAAFLTPSTPA